MIMAIDEACSLLNKENPQYETLDWAFHHMGNGNRLIVARKDQGMFEVIDRLKEQRMFPIVDKTLRLVLGVDSHLYLMSELFLYHYRTDDLKEEKPHIGTHESADRFVTDGYGYFISSLAPSTIVVGETYHPDTLDKDLFATHSVDVLASSDAGPHSMLRIMGLFR